MSTQFQHHGGATVPLDREHPPDEAAREFRDRQRNYPPLLKYLNKTCDAIANLDKQERVRIREAQVKAQAFYDNRQDGEVRDGVWRDNPYVSGEMLPKDNEYKIQVDKLNMEMTRTDTDFEVEAVDSADSAMDEAAKFLKHRLTVNRERTETEAFKQAENLSLLLKTINFRHVLFNPNAEGDGVERMPKVGKRDGQAMRVTVCRTCGMPQGVGDAPTGEAATDNTEPTSDYTEQVAETTPCVGCGDTVHKEVSADTSGGLNLSYEEVSGGRVVTVRPDAAAVQLDMQARGIESSRFLRWTLTLRRCEWEQMFPGKKIPHAAERSDTARWAEDLQGHPSNDTWSESFSYESGDAGGDYTGGDQFEKIEGELIWLDKVVYADYRNQQDETTPTGVLPKGMALAEKYADGCCIARIGQTILDLYPSNKNKCWSMCVYGLREHALHGSGTFALLGPCETLNDLNAFIHANICYNSAPREFIRSGSIAGNQLPAIGQVGVVTGQFDEDRRIVGYAYDKAPATSLAADVYGFHEAKKGSLQEHAGTSSLSLSGAADYKALGTATGVEAARDQAVGRMIPNLKLKTDMQREWAYQVVELEHANCSPEMFLDSAGVGNETGELKYTARGVEAFFKANIRTDFRIKPVPGSWMPTTPHQEKANKAEFSMLAAQVGGLEQGNEILATIAPTYGVDYEINEYGAVKRVAMLRLREWARVAAIISQAGYPPTPQLAAVVLEKSPPWAHIDPLMDNHEAYREYLSDWIVSDEGLQADPMLRAVIQLAYMEHGKGLVAQAQLTAVGEIAAQAPMQEAAMEQASAQAEQSMQIQGAQTAQELAGEEARLQIEGQREGMKLAAAEQGAMVKAGDREHQLAVRQATGVLRQQ